MADQIAKNRQEMERRIQQIRDNADLSDQAKRRMIQETYEEAMRRHRELADERRAQTADRINRLERDMMRIRYPLGASDVEKETIRMSYRDAYDRAYYASPSGDPGELTRELSRLLERAERSGDPQLADAIYHVATENGIRSVADAYLESRPDARERWEAYAQARLEEESMQNRMFGEMPPAEPAELAG
jgi:hypothetical protein